MKKLYRKFIFWRFFIWKFGFHENWIFYILDFSFFLHNASGSPLTRHKASAIQHQANKKILVLLTVLFLLLHYARHSASTTTTWQKSFLFFVEVPCFSHYRNPPFCFHFGFFLTATIRAQARRSGMRQLWTSPTLLLRRLIELPIWRPPAGILPELLASVAVCVCVYSCILMCI
jgi:hypothetical protein